jgi:hypothetical protein
VLVDGVLFERMRGVRDTEERPVEGIEDGCRLQRQSRAFCHPERFSDSFMHLYVLLAQKDLVGRNIQVVIFYRAEIKTMRSKEKDSLADELRSDPVDNGI